MSKTNWKIFGLGKFTNLEYVVSDGSAVILTDDNDTAPYVFTEMDV